jgi:hypothetical protein
MNLFRRWAVMLGLFGACHCAGAYRRRSIVFTSVSMLRIACSENMPVSASAAACGVISEPLWSSQIVERSHPSPNNSRAASASFFEAYAFIAPSKCSAISTPLAPASRQTIHISTIVLPWFAGSGFTSQTIGAICGQCSREATASALGYLRTGATGQRRFTKRNT